MALFTKTGLDRVAAILDKVSSIADDLHKGLEEIDGEIVDNTAAIVRLELDNQELKAARARAAAFAHSLAGMLEV